MNEKILAVWPIKSRSYPATLITLGHLDDLNYFAQALQFSVRDLESHGISRSETHFICYHGINPYRRWQELANASKQS